MNTEEKLRQYILSKNRSLLEFTKSIDMPYGTIQSIFKRGIMNSSVDNIIKICVALGISADELTEGNIVPVSPNTENKKIDIVDIQHEIIFQVKDYEKLCLDGIQITEEEADFIIDSSFIVIEQLRNRRKRKDLN